MQAAADPAISPPPATDPAATADFVPTGEGAPLTAAPATVSAVGAAPVGTSAVNAGNVATGTPTVPAAPAAPAAAPVSGGLKLVMSGECWIEVRDAAGTLLRRQVLRAGESASFAGKGPWSVVLGDARNASVRVGDRELVVPGDKRSGLVARFLVAADGTLR
jgi:cytoskeleton protein RodZ